MDIVPVALQAIYGQNDITKIIQDFDWKSMDVKDNTKQDFLTVKLAPSFGNLNKGAMKDLDEELKIMIAGTTKKIGEIKPEDRTWDNVVSVMAQNVLLEPAGDLIHKADKLIKEGFNAFKFEGAPDQIVVNEVKNWFANLIGDEDVLKATPINIEELANIVAQSGATVSNVIDAVMKHEHHEKTVVDIGVLRYPDISHPYFKVYRILLTAWSDCDRTLAWQTDKNGILGGKHTLQLLRMYTYSICLSVEYTRRDYKPRKDILDSLSAATKTKAIAEAEALFA